MNLSKAAAELWQRYCHEKGLDPEKAKSPRVVRNTAVKGRAFEYRVRDDLKAKGWWVIRAAGSKGSADLVALMAWGQSETLPLANVVVVSCKGNGKIRTNERQRLITDAHHAGAEPVIARPGDDGPRYTLATGGEEWEP